MNQIINRILMEIDEPALLEKVSGLSPSDFNSLLLELYKSRAEKIAPNGILKSMQTNRYALPSTLNPAAFHSLEAELFAEAERQNIKGLLLSPVGLFGSCSVFGYVDQNNVISAGKGTEVLSDPTNMLAIIIADRLKKGEIDNREAQHFCSTARVTRGQATIGRRSFPHFGLFCIVSAGKAMGSYGCEQELMIHQLAFYKKLFEQKYSASLSVTLSKRGGYSDIDGFFNKMTELITEVLPDVPITLDNKHTDNAYYKGINYKILMHIGEETIEIGDGGFVDWLQKLTGNNKERCLISGIGLDRLLMVDGLA